ncbi:unnamed protein product [Notodromas monacha]|uniref:CWH43-like N-terminal domain-containing protein n=1 Tax=Notodromas monacha TaxID=399045 RepID=A0A7R9BK82_9CRUS|nr:unnamed protein product [Notodromas monacha]CAG0917032.1 unnamed protein product [Notodromas monacha]
MGFWSILRAVVLWDRWPLRIQRNESRCELEPSSLFSSPWNLRRFFGGANRRVTRAVKQESNIAVPSAVLHRHSVESSTASRRPTHHDFGASHFVFVLPIIVILVFPLTFILNYIIAVSLGHVVWNIAYISDTGCTPPESSVFSFFLSLGTVVVAMTTYVRYKQVKDACFQLKCGRAVKSANSFSWVFSLLFCLGLLAVATFQTTSLRAVHYAGAVTLFLSGAVYSVLQAYVSMKLFPAITSKRMKIVRIIFAVWVVVGFLSFMVFGIWAVKVFDGDPESGKWRPEDAGFTQRVISVISEWFTALVMLAFIGSYVGEFRHVHATAPSVFYRIDPERMAVQDDDVLDDDDDDLESDFPEDTSVEATSNNTRE